MSNTQENYVNKANAAAIINKIETKLNNRYTKDEVDSLLESFYTKIEANSMVAGYAAIINGDTLSLNNENIGI